MRRHPKFSTKNNDDVACSVVTHRRKVTLYIKFQRGRGSGYRIVGQVRELRIPSGLSSSEREATKVLCVGGGQNGPSMAHSNERVRNEKEVVEGNEGPPCHVRASRRWCVAKKR